MTTTLESPTAERRPIAALPSLLVNQIAAGEVVDRPASVVKELVENALDAGASHITIELEQGGIELIRITDDGSGIPASELPLAVAPHATSKIARPEDLDRIATMGFRGEALASIASVSRLMLRSRTAQDQAACVLEIEGDVLSPVRPASGPVGTQLSVRNVFFNTPARRKFLRTPQTEQGHCVDAACALAISHPGVGFRIITDTRVALDVPANQNPRERALAVLGTELSGELLECSSDRLDELASSVARASMPGSPGVSARSSLVLWGLVGRPSIARATPKNQHVFLNGRPIRDKVIQHALREAYRGLIEPGRYPTAVLMIELDPASVDVNVHPAKTEVRFRDQSMVHSAVLRAVREALQKADLTPGVHAQAPWRSTNSPIFGPGNVASPAAHSPTSPQVATSLVEFLRSDQIRDHAAANAAQRFEYQEIRQALGRLVPEAIDNSPAMSALTQSTSPAAPADPAAPAALPLNAQSTPEQPSPDLPMPRRADRHLQVHNSFVVTQDDQGLLIVDQHALHERVMFEALLARVSADRGGARPATITATTAATPTATTAATTTAATSAPTREPSTDSNSSPTCTSADSSPAQPSPLESQRLLVPVVVPITRTQAANLDALSPLLARIGIAAEMLSPEALGLHAFPTFLFDRGVDPIDFVGELFTRAEADGFVPGSEEALHEVLDMMACKAAIKAGDKLSESELTDLLRLREVVERSSNCPHGRPTSIRLSIAELERRFGRT